VKTLRAACHEVLGVALGHYEQIIEGTVPDKMPMRLQVHRRAGEDCSSCGARIEAIHFKDYVILLPGGADGPASAE
jgi:formamidopyrimidine-DNA glycosylase